MKRIKIFKFVDEPIGVKRVRFEVLRAGDVFYSEMPNGELIPNINGGILEIAVSDVYYTENKKIPGIEVKPV